MHKMHIVVFTGAGVSRESNIPTFRDGDGLWHGHNVEEVGTAAAWRKNPEGVLNFFNDRRREVQAAEPNAAHFAIAELENHYNVTVITQNIDDLHERAGSSHVMHLHGLISKQRSDIDDSVLYDCLGDIEYGVKADDGGQMRPHIVLFDEIALEMVEAKKLAKNADAILVVGTMLEVFPAANVVLKSKAPHIWVVDPNPPSVRKFNHYRMHVRKLHVHFIRLPATEGVPVAIQEMEIVLGKSSEPDTAAGKSPSNAAM